MPDDPVDPDRNEIEKKNCELHAKLCGIRERRRTFQELCERQNKVRLALEDEQNRVALERERVLLDFRSGLAVQMKNVKLLDLFMQWNAITDCFHISVLGAFGTINGLRLGLESPSLEPLVEPIITSPTPAPETRRFFSFTGPATTDSSSQHQSSSRSPPIRVPWTEINAALGQVALLLSTLAKIPHCGIVYRHQIITQGSTSKIGMRRNGSYITNHSNNSNNGNAALSVYNLHHDDSFQLFGRRNFNTALECLCECVMDAAEAVQKRDRTISLPHAIERIKGGDLTIGGLLVSFPTVQQDPTEWTRAMKYLLTNVKHIMTFRLFLGSSII
jgi:beclin 1